MASGLEMMIANLTDRSVIQVSGDDAADFLQNLVTCNIASLNEGDASFGALLSPQGKIQFEFIVQSRADHYLLDVQADQAADLIKRLTFYKLRAKVDIAMTDLKVNVRSGEDELLDQDWFNDPRLEGLGQRCYTQEAETGDPLNWHLVRIKTGVPELGHDFGLNDVFPHEALYDQYENAGVDFTKGCYVGQEVVSRMQHRGTARSRFMLCQAQGNDELPECGSEITIADRKIGKMGSHIGSIGLALVRIDKLKVDSQPVSGGTNLTLSKPEFCSFGEFA